LDYSLGQTCFEGARIKINDILVDETKGIASANILDRYEYGKRV
jgi:hypothetical protein